MRFFHKKKLNIGAVIIAVLLFCPIFLYAQETTIESGEAKLIMEFNAGLNIPAGDSLKLVYTGNASDPLALLRDTSGNPSYWGGTFWSNYNVIFTNPNGITIGPNANIQAASFIASTLDISNDNFLHPEKYNQRYIFSKWVDRVGKSVINNGYIKVREGGQVVLLGSAAANGGTIEATLGSVALAAGETVTLGLDTAGMISVAIDQAVKEEIFTPDGQKLTSAVENRGTILANGGKVVLAAKVLNKVFDYAVNNSGIIQAKSMVNHQGVIELLGEGEAAVKTVINTGSIIVDGTVGLPNAGKISIEGATILQQGLISANADEEGIAGEISIVSQTSTTVDTGSNTEAKAAGLAGNGGRILIDSTGGNTVVNKHAVIDVSAGAISGNGGFIEVSAFDQLGFYGILNGRAPPGYKPGTAIIDPEQTTVSGAFSANTTIYSPSGITIIGDITLTGAITFNIYADHNSETASDWHDGTGNITRSGDYTITGTSATLSLKAGSGIGTSATPIKTNVANLSAENSTSSDIYIDQGTTNLTVTSVVNSASGKMVGIVSDGDLLIGWISCDNVGLNALGSIDGLGTLATNIKALDLVLNAGEDIGANYPLFINVVTFSAYAANGDIGAETSSKMGLVYDMSGALLEDDVQVSVVGNAYAVTITDDGYFEIKSVNLTTPVILKITKDGYRTYYSFKSSGRAQNNIYLFTDAQYTGLLALLDAFLVEYGKDARNPAKGLVMGMFKDAAAEGEYVYGPGITATLKDASGEAVSDSDLTMAYFNPAEPVPTFYTSSQATTCAFFIINAPVGEDLTLSAQKTGSEFSTYQVQAFTDGLTLGVVKPLDDTYLRIAIFSGASTTDTDLDGLPDTLEATLGTNAALADTDSDTLTDYVEYLKYRTNPLSADSDDDGKLDNDWDERREYVYTIEAHGKTLQHAEIADMNDFFQDARSLGTFSWTFTDSFGNVITLTEGLEYEIVLYPDAVQLVVPKSYPLTYSSDLAAYAQESVTITISPLMKAKVEEIINLIPVGERTDLNIADTLLKWLKENTLDALSAQYSPSMLSEMVASADGLRLKYQESGNTYRTDNGEQTFERYEIFSDQQFRSGKRGSCGSTTDLLTGLLRAAGIPTRMVLAVTLIPKNDDAGYYADLVESGIHNAVLKSSLLAFLDQAGTGGWNHFTPEAYINGQWVRMDQVRPDDVGIGPLQNTVPNIKLFTMVDYTDFALADNDGRLMTGDGPVWFTGDTQQLAIHTISLEDQDAVNTTYIPSGTLPPTLPAKETASYNLPTADMLKAPVFLRPGIIVVNDATRLSATINTLQAKDIGAILAEGNRSLVIDKFTLTGASNEAYIESATKKISMLNTGSSIDVDSLDLFAGDDVSLTGNMQDLTATVLIDLSDPKTEGTTHDFTLTNGPSLDINYVWHNNGKIRIKSNTGTLNAVEIITYLGGSISLTSAINTNSANAQISNSAVLHPVPLDAAYFGRYRLNTFNPPGGPLYFWRHLTPIDIPAFGALNLGNNAYRFIGGKIMMR